MHGALDSERDQKTNNYHQKHHLEHNAIGLLAGYFHAHMLLYQKLEIFDILGVHSHHLAPIEVKFCTAKRTQVPVGHTKFDMNRCKESSLRDKKTLIFGL